MRLTVDLSDLHASAAKMGGEQKTFKMEQQDSINHDLQDSSTTVMAKDVMEDHMRDDVLAEDVN